MICSESPFSFQSVASIFSITLMANSLLQLCANSTWYESQSMMVVGRGRERGPSYKSFIQKIGKSAYILYIYCDNAS